ncbi:alpha/beta hydrolase [Sphingomonas sp.]|uniref:alpha/beta fold hydrolase n=1 Tax=Sphingomonas sp. TaxID=28214 RepID=UPI0025CC00F2|nr:alpha/beta hydrolase [Sphingomonas sp.]
MTTTDDIGPTSYSFVSQRLRLNYLDWGNPEAPTLILVHGGRDHARSWDSIARALRTEWHIIAPDLRGHGDSGWSPDGVYSMPFFICDLAQLVHQQGSAPVTIVAHSLGGIISLRYAGLFPERVRKLVAIEGLGLGQSPDDASTDAFVNRWRKWIDERRALSSRTPRRYASIDEALERMRSENRHLSEDQARQLTIHGVNRNEDGSYSWKFDNYLRSSPPLDISTAELHALWNRIECPTLLAYGNDSWASNPATDGNAAHFRTATVKTYDNAGHWLHHDRFDSFLADLRAFL